MLCLFPVFLFAGDSAENAAVKKSSLRGYKKLLYNIVLLHPKMSSGVERELLKHYLLGSGSAYILSDSDFVRLKKTIPLYARSNQCMEDEAADHRYCVQYVDLNDDAYFGWALGNIAAIYQSGTNIVVSLADIYNFNKMKKGIRTRKNEFITRTFRFLAPASAKPFAVTYPAEGFIVKP